MEDVLTGGRRRRPTHRRHLTGFVVSLGGLAALGALIFAAGGGSHSARSAPAGAIATIGASDVQPAGGGTPGGEAAPAAVGPATAAERAVRVPLPAAGGRSELARAFHHWLGMAGPHTGALVVDLSGGGRVLVSHSPDVGRPPASVEKLYTTYALLRDLGAGVRLRTEVLGAGRLTHGGAWRGDLYLRGGGDPTFGSAAFNRVWSGGAASTVEALATVLRRRGIRRVTGRVIADASLFDALRGGPGTGYKADPLDMGGQLSALTYNHGASVALTPEAFAAQQLATSLRRMHIGAQAAPAGAAAPSAARVLAVVHSPPIATLVRLMDIPSDDLYAELLTKQLGARLAGSGSIEAGARVITRTVATLGIHPRIIDGSGLSRHNASSPAQIVQLLVRLSADPLGRTVNSSLPVLGQTGTVRRVGAGTAAAGRCRAKTGTLNMVSNLAGWCRTLSGHELAFAIMLDGPPNSRGYPLLGHMAADMTRLDPRRP